jgi:hypothetical protein
MNDSRAKDLAYRHSEIARLTVAFASARLDTRATNVPPTELKHHEDRAGRPYAFVNPTRPY